MAVNFATIAATTLNWLLFVALAPEGKLVAFKGCKITQLLLKLMGVSIVVDIA